MGRPYTPYNPHTKTHPSAWIQYYQIKYQSIIMNQIYKQKFSKKENFAKFSIKQKSNQKFFIKKNWFMQKQAIRMGTL